MIRKLALSGFETILKVINESAQAYKGIIPNDRWKEPYMSAEELRDELASGVVFYGWVEDDVIVGVMGIQPVKDTVLLRHSYILTKYQGRGIGGKLLRHLISLTITPEILVGTWKAATWAVRFYEEHGFKLVSSEEKDRLLRKYWNIPKRQIETSVVLKFKNNISVEDVLSNFSSYSAELGLDLCRPEDRFKWFLASILFAKRISSEIAKKTYCQFEREGLTTPKIILEAGWDRLVEVLDSGGYARYDFSTATNLLEIMRKLKEYGGLEKLHNASMNSRDLEGKLQEFKGVGLVCVNIFLRELRGIWDKADPEPSKIAVETGRRLGLGDVRPYESSLVRLSLEYCKKSRCFKCSVKNLCSAHVET
jgi:GNAT superfamily N-acetyltransferase/endonuclease III